MSALLPPFRRAAALALPDAGTADRRRSFRRGVGAVLVVGLLVGLPPAVAQDASEDGTAEGDGSKPAADPLKNAAWTKIEQESKGIRDALKAGGAFDAAARDFLVRKAVPQLANDSNRPIIDRVRRQLRDFVLVGIADDRSFDEASKVIADAAVAIARDTDASRAARVNAMLLVGDLRGKDGKEGTVWAPAAGSLAAVAGDATIDPSVRIAAMAGLSRHADVARKAGGDKATDFAKAARPAVIAIIAETPSAVQPVASDWLVSRALSLVTTVMKSAPKDFAATLAKLVGDTTRSVDVRVRAAGALGATVTPKSEIQAAETVGTITGLAVAVIEEDEAVLRGRRYEQQFMGGGQGAMAGMMPPGGSPASPGRGKKMMGMPMAPGAMSMSGAPEIEVPQLVPDQAFRRTAWRLMTLADALLTEDGKAGVAALLSGEDKENSKAYAEIYREEARKIDESRTDDALLMAIATIRPDEDLPVDEAAPAEGAPAAPKPASDEADPFGGK